MEKIKVGVIGAGTMGAGIAQVAAQSGHEVCLIDLNSGVLDKAKSSHEKIFSRLVEKQKVTLKESEDILKKITYSSDYAVIKDAGIVIEAIVENLAVKHEVFAMLETVVSEDCILASNTSSLSIASIGSVLKNSSRSVGIHFFNPAPLMALVEVVPGIQTDKNLVDQVMVLIKSWSKVPALVKDTPGFIVNRVARPFYGEALRIYEEGIADFATIDWAMTEIGGFKMGPFTLMDYIGNDVNYAVTETVFTAFYFDPRFKPSFTQKRHAEAGFLGRKSGRGYYDYSTSSDEKKPLIDRELGETIFMRIFCMLVNEAYDALFMNVASLDDIELAMTKGVNYPKGLFEWSKEVGLRRVLSVLEELFKEYGEDRYRPNPLLRREVLNKI
jgi:3-hydroxybutyryl-CoA dehydrogenase